MLLVPLHQVLCVFDGQHPMLSGEITLSQAGHGRVGWDGNRMDGRCRGGWMLFVVALSIRETAKRYMVLALHGGTWLGTYRNGVSKYMPIGTYRFVVLCTGYGTYPPLLLLSLNLKTSLWPGPDLGSSPPRLLPGPCPEVALTAQQSPSHAQGPGQPKQISPPSTSQLHCPPLSIVLLMTQAQIPWEGVPVLRCFSGKIHPPSTVSHHSPSRGTFTCPNPTQPGTGVHYIYIPSPSPPSTITRPPLPLTTYHHNLTTTTSPRRRNTLRPVCPRSNPHTRRPLHLEESTSVSTHFVALSASPTKVSPKRHRASRP